MRIPDYSRVHVLSAVGHNSNQYGGSATTYALVPVNNHYSVVDQSRSPPQNIQSSQPPVSDSASSEVRKLLEKSNFTLVQTGDYSNSLVPYRGNSINSSSIHKSKSIGTSRAPPLTVGSGSQSNEVSSLMNKTQQVPASMNYNLDPSIKRKKVRTYKLITKNGNETHRVVKLITAREPPSTSQVPSPPGVHTADSNLGFATSSYVPVPNVTSSNSSGNGFALVPPNIEKGTGTSGCAALQMDDSQLVDMQAPQLQMDQPRQVFEDPSVNVQESSEQLLEGSLDDLDLPSVKTLLMNDNSLIQSPLKVDSDKNALAPDSSTLSPNNVSLSQQLAVANNSLKSANISSLVANADSTNRSLHPPSYVIPPNSPEMELDELLARDLVPSPASIDSLSRLFSPGPTSVENLSAFKPNHLPGLTDENLGSPFIPEDLLHLSPLTPNILQQSSTVDEEARREQTNENTESQLCNLISFGANNSTVTF